MAIATTSDFELTRDEMIYAALRKITAQRDSFDASEVDNAAQALNLIVKGLQNFNIFLWATQLTTQALNPDSEVTGTDGLIYTCRKGHTSAASNRPVTGADYSTYWEQTGSTGGVWVTSTAYTSRGDFTLSTDIIAVDAASYRQDDSDHKIKIVSNLDYFKEYDKFQTGDPVKLTVEKNMAGNIVRLWPVPDSALVIHLQTVSKLKDFDGDDNNPDFPVRWYEFLIYRLAERLSPEYGVDYRPFKATADELFVYAKKREQEDTDCDFMRPM